MTMTENSNFQPDWVSAPGETIADILEQQNLSASQFAERMRCAPEDAVELLSGRGRITIETARRLEALLGGSARFWMTRESQYRQDLSRLKREARPESAAGWLTELPLKDMIEFGWIEAVPRPAGAVAACLKFFGVGDVGKWRETYFEVLEMAAFRTSPSFESQPGAVAAWLRQGEIESTSIDCNPWDAKRFRGVLSNIRALTRKKDPNFFIPELVRRCAECGVAVVILRAPTGCRASGATRFLSPVKALLLLSFRYLSDDHFWFTFFHEAGHLLLHSRSALFLEVIEMASITKEENEANEFAAHMLVPPEFQSALLEVPKSGLEVVRFARRVGISPGIVVGQLQHLHRIKRSQLNNLKRRFKWSKD